jgi:hypothetical protein
MKFQITTRLPIGMEKFIFPLNTEILPSLTASLKNLLEFRPFPHKIEFVSNFWWVDHNSSYKQIHNKWSY